MARTLTFLRGKQIFHVSKNLVVLPTSRNSSSRLEGAANLVNHLSKCISDVTIAFPDPENVDFGILFRFRSNFIMC